MSQDSYATAESFDELDGTVTGHDHTAIDTPRIIAPGLYPDRTAAAPRQNPYRTVRSRSRSSGGRRRRRHRRRWETEVP
jgi:hypothetical protein